MAHEEYYTIRTSLRHSTLICDNKQIQFTDKHKTFITDVTSLT